MMFLFGLQPPRFSVLPQASVLHDPRHVPLYCKRSRSKPVGKPCWCSPASHERLVVVLALFWLFSGFQSLLVIATVLVCSSVLTLHHAQQQFPAVTKLTNWNSQPASNLKPWFNACFQTVRVNYRYGTMSEFKKMSLLPLFFLPRPLYKNRREGCLCPALLSCLEVYILLWILNPKNKQLGAYSVLLKWIKMN